MRRGLGPVAAIGLALGAALPAGAHSELVRAEPAVGAALGAPPTAVRLEFSGPLGSGSAIQVTDAAFTRVDRGDTAVDPADPAAMAVGLAAVPAGEYTVQWTTIDPVDGHMATGSYAFRVEPAPAAPTGPIAAVVLAAAVLVALVARRRARPAA